MNKPKYTTEECLQEYYISLEEKIAEKDAMMAALGNAYINEKMHKKQWKAVAEKLAESLEKMCTGTLCNMCQFNCECAIKDKEEWLECAKKEVGIKMNKPPRYRPAKCCYTCEHFRTEYYLAPYSEREGETICDKYGCGIYDNFICASYEEVKVVEDDPRTER